MIKIKPGIYSLGVLLAACLILSACAPATKKGAETLPRPAHAYIYWLQKESLQNQAPELIAEVSQSGRVWLQASAPGRANVLAKAAPNWLFLKPPVGKDGVFSKLAPLVAAMPGDGIEGLYLGDTGEKPDILLSRENRPALQNSASLQFDASFGDDNAYAHLADAAEHAGLELGATILPGATGQGPDFLLQARKAPGSDGLYAMLPVPPETLLPLARDEWDFQPLPQTAQHAIANFAPAKLARDEYPWASPGGWALTGTVVGMDGQLRRWLYRYGGNIHQPLLAWQDPGGQAGKVLAASVIRQTGILGQSLVGLAFEPLMGLEPPEPGAASLSPGLEVVNELSRQIHRYGGWALQADAVPVSVMTQVLAGACDFCRDDVTELLVAFGLLAADGRPVAQLYRDWLAAGTDTSRLARGMASNDFAWRLLLDKPEWEHIWPRLSSLAVAPTWEDVFSNLGQKGKIDASALWEFVLVWRLGMPGLAFLDYSPGQELSPWLKTTLKNRKAANLAAGKVISVLRGQGGALGILTALPGGGYWLLACNFGVHHDSLQVKLPKPVKSAVDAGANDDLGKNLAANLFGLSLDGRSARNVVFN